MKFVLSRGLFSNPVPKQADRIRNGTATAFALSPEEAEDNVRYGYKELGQKILEINLRNET